MTKMFKDPASGTIYTVMPRTLKGTYGIFETYGKGYRWHESIYQFPSRWWRHKESAEKFLAKYATEHGWEEVTT